MKPAEASMPAAYRAVLVDYDPDLFDVTAERRSLMEAGLAPCGARLAVARCETDAEVLAVAAGADLVLIQSLRPLLNARTIPGLARCRGIIRLGLGYDSVAVAAATGAGIPVSNVVDWCTEEVADHAAALLLAGARHLQPLNQGVQAGAWSRGTAAPIHRLRGRVLGLIGFGRVAQAVARRMAGFGVVLLAYDPGVTPAHMAACGVTAAPLPELLGRADLVSVHARLSPTSQHLLDAAAFAAMKHGVYLVNTARGPIIDEAALVAALAAGQVRGAGLDVMEAEPLPAESPLRGCANVLLTPHVASYSVEAVTELYRLGAEYAGRLLQGQWLPTIVNPEVRVRAEARWGAYAPDRGPS